MSVWYIAILSAVLIIGVLYCFWGYKTYKPIVPILLFVCLTFLVDITLFKVIEYPIDVSIRFIIALLVVALLVISSCFDYRFRLFCLGGVFALLVGFVLYNVFGILPFYVLIISGILFVVFGILTLVKKRFCIFLFTSLIGSLLITGTLVYLVMYYSVALPVIPKTLLYKEIPLLYMVIVFGLLSAVGFFVQYKLKNKSGFIKTNEFIYETPQSKTTETANTKDTSVNTAANANIAQANEAVAPTLTAAVIANVADDVLKKENSEVKEDILKAQEESTQTKLFTDKINEPQKEEILNNQDTPSMVYDIAENIAKTAAVQPQEMPKAPDTKDAEAPKEYTENVVPTLASILGKSALEQSDETAQAPLDEGTQKTQDIAFAPIADKPLNKVSENKELQKATATKKAVPSAAPKLSEDTDKSGKQAEQNIINDEQQTEQKTENIKPFVDTKEASYKKETLSVGTQTRMSRYHKKRK